VGRVFKKWGCITISSRYFITGVQLGILKALKNHCEPFKKLDEILNEVIDKQFIGNMPYPYEDYEIVFIKKPLNRHQEKIKCPNCGEIMKEKKITMLFDISMKPKKSKKVRE